MQITSFFKFNRYYIFLITPLSSKRINHTSTKFSSLLWGGQLCISAYAALQPYAGIVTTLPLAKKLYKTIIFFSKGGYGLHSYTYLNLRLGFISRLFWDTFSLQNVTILYPSLLQYTNNQFNFWFNNFFIQISVNFFFLQRTIR